MKRKEIAKFLCGVEAFHASFHAYLWAWDSAFVVFGIGVSSTINFLNLFVNGAIALLLGFYAWGAPRP